MINQFNVTDRKSEAHTSAYPLETILFFEKGGEILPAILRSVQFERDAKPKYLMVFDAECGTGCDDCPFANNTYIDEREETQCSGTLGFGMIDEDDLLRLFSESAEEIETKSKMRRTAERKMLNFYEKENHAKMVYIASPLAGDIDGNIQRAIQYSKIAAGKDVVPLAPHTIFTQYLDDTVQEERERGLEMGKALMMRCDEVWVFGSVISAGMRDEIKIAQRRGIPVRYFCENGEEKSNVQTNL